MSTKRSLAPSIASVFALTAAAFATTSARAQTAPTPSPAPTSATATPERAPLIPTGIGPTADGPALERQGDPSARPGEAPRVSGDDQIFSDDWWHHTRPVVEIHGFFRTRAELFHNFSLGRVDVAGQGLFPRPLDDTYSPISTNGTQAADVSVKGCGPTSEPQTGTCSSKTIASVNMRFRIDPEIHISDNLRILTQIDLLDNLVLGSTPEGSVSQQTTTQGSTSTQFVGRGGYVPLRSFSTTQVAPVAGINGYENSVTVKRIWAEYLTPLGQIRFGRMPSHWGLGILVNSGDRLDSDYQTNADRIMFVTAIKQYDLYIAGAWDFPNTGRTSATVQQQQGQPYNLSQLENTNQWVLAIFHRLRPDQQALRLARGEVVINGGMYSVYRQQILGNESSTGSYASDPALYQSSLVRLGAKAFIPDFWLQVLTKRLRWETEAVYIYGSIENPRGVANGTYQREDYLIRQFGIATELEYKAIGDELRLKFASGLATGDQGIDGLTPGEGNAGGLQPRGTSDKTISTFRFNPAYNIDLILFRQILTRVQGAYYFKPGVEYDFAHAPDGEKFGGRADVIYSRASKFVQTPGHKDDLGIELDVTLYYQSRDGSLNDDPSKIGGFYAMLQYGVLFPLGGLGYQSTVVAPGSTVHPDISSAQTVRLFLGVVY